MKLLLAELCQQMISHKSVRLCLPLSKMAAPSKETQTPYKLIVYATCALFVGSRLSRQLMTRLERRSPRNISIES